MKNKLMNEEEVIQWVTNIITAIATKHGKSPSEFMNELEEKISIVMGKNKDFENE